MIGFHGSVPLSSSCEAVFEIWVHASVLAMVDRRLSNPWQFAKVTIGSVQSAIKAQSVVGNMCCRFSTFLVGRESAWNFSDVLPIG